MTLKLVNSFLRNASKSLKSLDVGRDCGHHAIHDFANKTNFTVITLFVGFHERFFVILINVVKCKMCLCPHDAVVKTANKLYARIHEFREGHVTVCSHEANASSLRQVQQLLV